MDAVRNFEPLNNTFMSTKHMLELTMTFDSNIALSIAIIVSILNACLLCVAARRPIQVFQQFGYRTSKFAKWSIDLVKQTFFGRLIAFAMVTFGGMLILNIITYNHLPTPYLSYLGLLFYLGIGILFCLTIIFDKKPKVPLKFTPRIKRLFVITFILTAVITYILLWLGSVVIDAWVFFALIALTPLILPQIIVLANWLLFPLEAGIRTYYVRRAKRKLESPEFAHVTRVGITGSYGKTSCKNILTSMLEQKFKVASSPSSYNTPMGFALTINNILKPEHEILVFEMGLRYKRDISDLAKLFRPQHGILTAIGSQHIETMGSLEAIKAEKSELIRALPNDGIAILNGDSEKCIEVYNEFDMPSKHLTKVAIKSDEKGKFFATATDVKVSKDGCTFTINLNDKPFQCTTKLLGLHNIQNILMCAAMAHKLGCTSDHIATAISLLEPTPHRLQLIQAQTGVIILDDSYNASEQGTAAALEVLSLFEGRKIVQTPGIVEQGKRAHQTNFNYAKQIAKVADHVIIVNKTNRQALNEGLESENYPADKTHIVNTLAEAKALYPSLLKKGDVLLIANDLPDNFA